MNQLGLRFRDSEPAHGGARTDAIDLGAVVAAIRRQARPIAIAVAAMMALGMLILATTPPTYTAWSNVLVDSVNNTIVEEISAFENRQQTDSTLLNEIEVVRSQPIATTVARELNLAENETFLNPPSSLLGRVIGGAIVGLKALLPIGNKPVVLPEVAADTLTPEQRVMAMNDAIARRLQGRVIVRRVGRSYVLSIGFNSHDPALAAAITNSYARAYLADQLNANFEANERTSAWLLDRLSELETQSRAAALAAEQFRAEHNLADNDGQLMTTQNLAQLNTEMATAVAEEARARALAEQYEAVIAAGAGEGLTQRALSLDATNDPRLAQLQVRISTLSGRLSRVEQDFGEDHPQALQIRSQLSEETQAAYREVERLAEKYASDLAAAEARAMALRTTVGNASSESATANTLEVELRSLEQRATALSTLYQSYLTRFQEIDQQKSFPVSSLRILSFAETPRSASAPSTTRTMVIFILLGLIIGGAIAAIREYRERSFRTGDDVADATGLPFLGYLPDYTRPPRMPFWQRLLRRPAPALPPPPPPPRAPKLEFHAVQNPRSQYSETLRTIRLAADTASADGKGAVIGISSALPGEGKTTLSLNLAGLLASANRSTLLIDADLRSNGLTRLTRAESRRGLTDAILGNVGWLDARVQIGNPKLHFLPSPTPATFAHTSDLLGSKASEEIIAEARAAYDYVIVDLPPLGPVIDARVMLPFLDHLVVVAQWGRTPKGLLRQILAHEHLAASKALGVVLNRVDLDMLKTYSTPSGNEQFFDAYAPYYGGR